jgi:hypothetical protein
MATAKKSALDLESQAAGIQVFDVTDAAARAAGGVETDEDRELLNAQREALISKTMTERQVGRSVAILMVDTGYSKGTCNRIIGDRLRAENRKREAAQAGAQARAAKQPKAEATA